MISKKDKVLILGGGFAGLEAAIFLRKAGYSVTLVSDRDYFYIYPTSIWIPTGEAKFEEICVPLKELQAAHGFDLVIDEITETAVRFVDGTELPADLIVYATGYGSMNGWAADLISQDVADKVGKVWGLGSDTPKDPGPWEGEERNMWKPTQQENLWFHGGNLHQSRHYSLYLALQLKARMEGLETPVYALQRVHHLN